MTVQVRRAAMFLLFQLMSMFQAGSGRFWDNYMMEMLLYVEDHKTCFCQREWEQQLLQFLEDLLFFISDHTWLGCFIASIRRQLAHSDKRPGDKSFLYKCWGTVLMFYPAESIKPQLWLLVEMVDFREEEEREGFARALGLCARQHLYEIFAILEHWEDFVSRVQLQPSAGGSLEVRSHPASLLFHPSLHQSLQVTGPAREDPASQKPVQRRAEFPSNGSASVEGALSLPSVELQSQHNGVDPGGTVGPVV
ncbi:myb/SANT-like DNA-binding domain-containing protein 3 [Platysternon megacephalum]|uniref:Myb/SANT-like DNA-binding domain-containing protein 3 n=1 Tax=Platysternon megacephalum TaxID=55544 RepID=A0A4D9E7U5_9SAUR|nr:myb/SANT-like DNA-binding domain-containing protein 3 [Platysternon megacephalum]